MTKSRSVIVPTIKDTAGSLINAQNMRRNGNAKSNRTYNPKNAQPSIPLDVDEVDAALERFVRKKYDQQVFSGGTLARPATRHDTGSTHSSSDQPPPLPPKPGKRFGFGLRSVSSNLPSNKHSHVSPPTSPESPNGYRPPSPIKINKQSRVFGATVGGGGDDMDAKMATLRDMGFLDAKRNLNILKGLSGNLEKSIETLVRLGEGSIYGTRPRSPVKGRQIAVSQPIGLSQPFSTVGIEPQQTINEATSTIQATQQEERKDQSAIQPPAIQARTTSVTKSQQPHSYNLFDPSSSRADTWPLEQAFQNMQVSQPLFPNATGGYPIQPPHFEETRFQQSMTPPVPQTYQHFHSNPYMQQVQIPNASYNPFYRPTLENPPMANAFHPSNAHNQPQTSGTTVDPVLNIQQFSQTSLNHNIFQLSPDNSSQQIPQQQQQSYPILNQPLFTQAQQPYNQFPPQQVPNPPVQPQYQQAQPPNPFHPQPQPLIPQQTGRFDKMSILALYNYPQLAPPPPPSSSNQSHSMTNTEATEPSSEAPRALGQRSVTMPAQLISGSRNPFHTAATNNAMAVAGNGGPSPHTGVSRHVSQESVDIGGYQNGRHSPDAFASLSARFVR